MSDPRSTYEPLTESVRRLVELTIRTEAEATTIAEAKARIDSVVEDLSRSVMSSSFGVRQVADGQGPAWGNAVIGVRNPLAPPLAVHHEADGSVWSEFILGAQYEGPPGHVHGGICALVLDHVLGATAHQPGRPSVTGTLQLRYERGTPLGPLRAEAHVDRIEGVKTFAVGYITDAAGITVRAEGVFIFPRTR
ncbi:PaaI family thioesterase [Mycobacteroides abscessus]|uniref:PaaI family thioesterase n=1 Tax=Mycobacteroides abscessus TaxID=36809 RepID=UPI002106CC7D|nr:PaaI family thioesterase [Mycobacteroides abscessus]